MKEKKTEYEAYIGDTGVVYAVAVAGEDSLVEVKTSNDKVSVMPKKRYKLLKLDEPVSPLVMQEKFDEKMAQELYKVCVEYGCSLLEVDRAITRLVKQVNDSLTTATNSLWGIQDEHERTLTMINRVLLDAYGRGELQTKEKEGDDGATSDGGGATAPAEDKV